MLPSEVPDTSDGTPLDVLVDADGCSGLQYVALTCAAECVADDNTYITCVTHASNDAVRAGLITGREKGAITRAAARGGCH